MRTIVSAKQIYTLSDKQPDCRFMIIENGIVVELLETLPDSHDLESYAIQHEDAYIYPSFNDTHMHLIGYGASLSQCQLEKANSIHSLKTILHDYIHNNESDIIFGRGWNHDFFSEKRLPTRSDLDEVCHDKPVILYRVCGHIAVVNSCALEKYGINGSLVVEGGNIDLDHGVPTGILRENALSIVQNKLSIEDLKKFVLKAQAKLNEYGITSVQTDDLIMVPISRHREIIDLFKQMSLQNELTVRVYEQSQFFTTQNLEAHILSGYRQNEGDSFYKNGPLKILADGSLGARTAKLRGSYHDDSSASGIWIHSESELVALIETAFKNGLDVAVHGIGDYTIEFVTRQIARLQEKYSRPDARNAIVHCQIMDRPMIQAMAEARIHALVQPVFLEYDMTIVENRVGKALASTSYAYKSMLASGIILGFGSDAPVEDPNPFRSLYYALTRKRPDGRIYFPEECLTIDEALAAFTSNAAYFSHEETIKGKLEGGYLADFICLSKPIHQMTPQELLEAKIEATYLGGHCVYRRNHHEST